MKRKEHTAQQPMTVVGTKPNVKPQTGLMMRIFAIFSLLIVCCTRLHAGEVDKGLPRAKVIWKPSLDQKMVVLTITNTGSKAFKFFPRLGVYSFDPRPGPRFAEFGKGDFVPMSKNPDLDVIPSTLYPEPSPEEISKIVFPILEFANTDFPGFGYDIGGLTLDPVEIKAGETKEFKFSVYDHVAKHILASNEAVFLLRANGKNLSKVVMKRKNDTPWMQ